MVALGNSADSSWDPSELPEARVLVIDDSSQILEDFQRILMPRKPLFADNHFEIVVGAVAEEKTPNFSLEFALSGEVGVELVAESLKNYKPFHLAFVDENLGEGGNGLRVISQILKLDPDLEIVLISGSFQLARGELVNSLVRTERLLVLKKPFEAVEVRQLALAICEKRRFRDELVQHLAQLERKVDERTNELKQVNLELEREMQSRLAAERELREAQKLEAVGQLAAGIAHEINTPIQFIGDSVQFMHEAFDDLLSLVGAYREELESATRHRRAVNLETLDGLDEKFDFEFIRTEVPNAIERTTGGVSRVAEIVRGMKGFSHVDAADMARADLNAAIRDTLIIASNEYKYIAKIQTELAELPEVECYVGEINQVLLNLVVNAAHAIDERGLGFEEGLIIVRTWTESEQVFVSVRDNGGGVPEDIRHKIFEPFFTTKDVGKGTGQGLAIVRRIVVDSHGGDIELQTEPGEGSIFTISLPVCQRQELVA